ncbi:MAG: hypothetical protein RIC55_06640 [Pirellulaceae bacterium]
MNAPPFDIEKAHRWFAVEFNNRAWDLIEAESRTAQQEQDLIHAAHASTYHWRQIGTSLHYLRALTLLASAYNVVGDYSGGLRYANDALAMLAKDDLEDTPFDRAVTYACVARANAGLGKTDQARQDKQRARDEAAKLEDVADRQVFDDLLNAGEWHGVE